LKKLVKSRPQGTAEEFFQKGKNETLAGHYRDAVENLSRALWN